MKTAYLTLLTAALFSGVGATAVSAETAPAESTGSTVHVAFRDVDQRDIMGGVSSINLQELDSIRYSNYSLSNLGAHVAGYDGSLWNQGDALVLVDGVPREANNVTPSEISDITFLKGAQAVVLYGSRASKGAILITTKRGQDTDLRITVRGNAGLYVPKAYPHWLGSAEYMTLYNEARVNDGLEPTFTEQDIYNYASKTNPYRYPSTNFYSPEFVRKHYERYEGIAEFTGGGKFARFYAQVGLYNTNDLINFGEGKKNHTTRLNVRGNIDLTMNDWISGFVNTSASFYDGRGDLANYWSQSASMRPTTPGTSPFSPFIPIDAIDENNEAAMNYVNTSRYLIDGKYLIGGTQNNTTNPFAAMYAAGYNKYTSRHLEFSAGINFDLKQVTPGLKFKTQVAVDYATSYNTSINNEYAVYEAQWYTFGGKDYISSITKYGEDKHSGYQNISGSYTDQTIFWSGQFDYNRTFNRDHNVDAMFVATGHQKKKTGVYHHTSSANLGLHVGYNYKHRYYANFDLAMIHTAKLAPGHRNGFSPVGTIGWRLTEEDFMKDVDWLNELKLTATYGSIKQDVDLDFYMYQERFTSTGTWWGWNEVANSLQTVQSTRGGNTELGFIKRNEFNVGLETAMFNNALKVNANFFNTITDGIPVRASTVYPNFFLTYWPETSFVPYINYNRQRRTGVDLSINFAKKFGDVTVKLGLNGMYYNTKALRVSELVDYEWQKAEGQAIDALRGYKCLGFFQSEDEIAQSACIDRANTKPGDLKYQDMNGDGMIDSKDQVVLGKWGSPWHYGINLAVAYKGFTLYANGSGNAGGTAIMNNRYAWVYGDRKYSDIVRGRWTPETAETATYPRLTTQSGDINFVTSDFWTYNTDAFYLNCVQLTYDLPGKIFKDKFVKGLQLYVNGENLATICSNRKYRETAVGSTPQCRTYNFGLKINF